MEEVEEYRKYDYVEMFWQTIRKWKPKSNDRGSLMKLINALEEIGVDIEGIKTFYITTLSYKVAYCIKGKRTFAS